MAAGRLEFFLEYKVNVNELFSNSGEEWSPCISIGKHSEGMRSMNNRATQQGAANAASPDKYAARASFLTSPAKSDGLGFGRSRTFEMLFSICLTGFVYHWTSSLSK